jgi:hypothetical protein
LGDKGEMGPCGVALTDVMTVVLTHLCKCRGQIVAGSVLRCASGVATRARVRVSMSQAPRLRPQRRKESAALPGLSPHRLVLPAVPGATFFARVLVAQRTLLG